MTYDTVSPAGAAPSVDLLKAPPHTLEQSKRDPLLSYRLGEQARRFNKETHDNEAGAQDLVAEAGYSLLYQGSQAWIRGGLQLVDDAGNGSGLYKGNVLADTFSILPEPEQATYKSRSWYAQQIGSGIGYAVPFAITHNVKNALGLSLIARTEQAVSSTGELASLSNGIKMADSSLTGFVSDFTFRPVDAEESNGSVPEHLLARTKHGAGGATVLGTMTASSLVLRQASRPLAAALTGPGMLNRVARTTYDSTIGITTGIPAGEASAQVNAGLEHHRFATSEEREQARYTMAFTGGVLSASHIIPIDQKSIDLAIEKGKAKKTNAAAPRQDNQADGGKQRVKSDGGSGEQDGSKAALLLATTGGADAEVRTADKNAGKVTDTPAERAERPPVKLDIASMRELAKSGDLVKLRQEVERYYPLLQKAFPLPGEIESVETYMEYLSDPHSTWDMEHPRDEHGNIIGGLQYQVLDVEGKEIKKAGWLEHIWVDEGKRQEGYGSALLKHVQSRVQTKGGDVTFWEFNNPDKMTPDEIAEDAKGGITTQDRVDYWGKRGAYVLVSESNGEIVPYAQPGMDGQEPVTYLSTAWSKPGGLDGVKLSKSDYLKVLLAAHKTIADVESDPTVKEYKAKIDALPDQEFKFVKLSDYLAERAKQLKAQHEEGDPDAERRLHRWLGTDFATNRTIVDIDDVDHPNPEVVKAEKLQERSAPHVPWNRTVRQRQRFASLEGTRNVDVAVIGGGIVGLQVAHELGSNDVTTAVLQKGLIADGTTRFMGAMGTYAEDAGFGGIYNVHGPEGFAKRLRALIESRSSVQNLARKYGADWRDVNSYNISYDANDPALREEVDLLHRFGDRDPQFVTGSRAAEVFGPAQSAIIFPHEGNLNPYKLALGLAHSGKFSVYEKSPVMGITIGAPGDPVHVYTPEGKVIARKVVFATNGPSPLFHYLNDQLVPVQCFATRGFIGQKLPGNFFDTDSSAFTYWRQFNLPKFGPTETLIGGSARFLDKEPASAQAPRLNQRVEELFGVKPAQQDPITALIYTAYSDGIPIAGPHPKYPDIWTATGAGGTGLVNGNWIARTIRQQLLQPGSENLISPDRFDKSKGNS